MAKQPTQKKTKKPYHEKMAEQVIKALETGTAPWMKSWKPGEIPERPYNPITEKEYKGWNSVWLEMDKPGIDPRFCTYKQAESQGWQVKKGSKGTVIQYWKTTDQVLKKDKATGKPVLDAKGEKQYINIKLERPRAFGAVVFNGADIDGIPPLPAPKLISEAERHEKAELMLAASEAPIFHDQNDRAFYTPKKDEIHLPPSGQFNSPDDYYAVALHEIGHSTGHESRLNREGITGSNPFGSEGYAREELRAELSSYMMGEELGIGHDPSDHHSYIASWIKILQDDPKEIMRASRDAEAIKDYMMERLHEKELELSGQQEQPENLFPDLQQASKEANSIGVDSTPLPISPEEEKILRNDLNEWRDSDDPPDAFRYQKFSERIATAMDEDAKPETIKWARDWLSEIKQENEAKAEQSTISTAEAQARNQKHSEALRNGQSDNPRMQSYLDTLQDPEQDFANHNYMAFISQRHAERLDLEQKGLLHDPEKSAAMTDHIRNYANQNLSVRALTETIKTGEAETLRTQAQTVKKETFEQAITQLGWGSDDSGIMLAATARVGSDEQYKTMYDMHSAQRERQPRGSEEITRRNDMRPDIGIKLAEQGIDLEAAMNAVSPYVEAQAQRDITPVKNQSIDSDGSKMDTIHVHGTQFKWNEDESQYQSRINKLQPVLTEGFLNNGVKGGFSLELDEKGMQALGVANITDIGNEKIYMQKEEFNYHIKIDRTLDFERGEYDFTNQTIGIPATEKTENQLTENPSLLSQFAELKELHDREDQLQDALVGNLPEYDPAQPTRKQLEEVIIQSDELAEKLSQQLNLDHTEIIALTEMSEPEIKQELEKLQQESTQKPTTDKNLIALATKYGMDTDKELTPFRKNMLKSKIAETKLAEHGIETVGSTDGTAMVDPTQKHSTFARIDTKTLPLNDDYDIVEELPALKAHLEKRQVSQINEEIQAPPNPGFEEPDPSTLNNVEAIGQQLDELNSREKQLQEEKPEGYREELKHLSSHKEAVAERLEELHPSPSGDNPETIEKAREHRTLQQNDLHATTGTKDLKTGDRVNTPKTGVGGVRGGVVEKTRKASVDVISDNGIYGIKRETISKKDLIGGSHYRNGEFSAIAEKTRGRSEPLKPMAQRVAQAENTFTRNITEQFGFNQKQAETILEEYKKAKAVTLDVNGGRYNLTDGRFWEKGPMQNALKQAQKTPEPSPEPAQEKTWLAVPYDDIHKAKKAAGNLPDGTKAINWDKTEKSWYANPGADMAKLKKYLPENQPDRQERPEDPYKAFGEALAEAGLILDGNPVMDGTWQRVPAEGDKQGNTAGQYKGSVDNNGAGGFIINHRTDHREPWFQKGQGINPSEIAATKAKATEKKAERQAEQQQKHKAAAEAAQKQWQAMKPLQDGHPYLEKKGLPNLAEFGARQDARNNLVLPIRDRGGKIQALQHIWSKGNKQFTKDSNRQGGFHVVGGRTALKNQEKTEPVIISTGFATSASIHLATGKPVVVAFNDNNLKEVAETFKKAMPERPIVIMGDDDHHLTTRPKVPLPNVGKEKALEAAKSVGGAAIFPTFKEGPTAEKTDFNDLQQTEGSKSVRRQVEMGLSQARIIVAQKKKTMNKKKAKQEDKDKQPEMER